VKKRFFPILFLFIYGWISKFHFPLPKKSFFEQFSISKNSLECNFSWDWLEHEFSALKLNGLCISGHFKSRRCFLNQLFSIILKAVDIPFFGPRTLHEFSRRHKKILHFGKCQNLEVHKKLKKLSQRIFKFLIVRFLIQYWIFLLTMEKMSLMLINGQLNIYTGW